MNFALNFTLITVNKIHLKRACAIGFLALSGAVGAAHASSAAPGAGTERASVESSIRATLTERMQSRGMPAVLEVRPAPVLGLFEVRLTGNQIIYADATGNFILKGALLDTRSGDNLTQQRVDQLNAIAFNQLPLRDSLRIVRGNGRRSIAVFQDPNCGFCKRLEADLAQLTNVTIHVFLFPILGESSITKAQNVWCSRSRSRVWQDWMVRNVVPPAIAERDRNRCDTGAMQRNKDFAQRHGIQGTPTIIFADGSRLIGAPGLEALERRLSEAGAVRR